MSGFRKLCFGLLLSSLTAGLQAAVHIAVGQTNGIALINYECTGGEVVRAFALDVTVDRGTILEVSDFLRGPSKAGARGYGIFPASFRDHLSPDNGNEIDWQASGYTPLAVVADAPEDTEPGINSPGVTLEFGGLWDPYDPAAVPGPAGTLCSIRVSDAANISVTPNAARGGVVLTSGESVTPNVTGAFVAPLVLITDIALEDGNVTIRFVGGELESASSPNGPWARLGNSSGLHTEAMAQNESKFFRVRHAP